jgi:hypothetical protein
MLFLVTWNISCGNRDATNARFKKTGGPPPAGVKMIGRWHSAAGARGAVIAEADDAVALAKWIQQWSDLIQFEITPVVDDADMMKVLG